MSSTFDASIALRSVRSVFVASIERTVDACEHLMDAVAELVRERRHVTRLAEEIDQNVGMSRWRRRMRECAWGLARPHRRIDPAFVEEAPGDIAHARREGAIGAKHHVARGLPLVDAPRRIRQRRVAVPMVELRLAEPSG